MARAPFTIHGTYQLRVRGRLILSEIVGPWNIEMLDDFASQFAPLAAQLGASGPIGSLGIHTGSLLTSPESNARLRKMVTHGKAHYQLRCCATVTAPDVEGFILARSMLEPIYAGVVPFRVFDRLEPAVQWMETVLRAEGLGRSGDPCL